MITRTTDDKTRIKAGTQELAKVVGSTMGAMGRSVLIQSLVPVQDGRVPDGVVRPTKDGITVAKHFVTTGDPLMDYGVRLLQAASDNVRKDVGDGTTQTIVLGDAFCFDIPPTHNAHEVEMGMRKAVDDVIDMISTIKRDVKSLEELMNVARVSANNHPIADEIATLVFSLTKDGVLYSAPSATGVTYTERFDGFVADWGVGPMFMDSPSGVSIGDAFIALTDYHITDFHKHLQPIMLGWLKRAVSDSGVIRPLVLVCKDCDGPAMKAILGARGNFAFDPNAKQDSGLTPSQKAVLARTKFLPIIVVKVEDKEGKRERMEDLAAMLSPNPKKHILASWYNGTGLQEFTKDLLLECKTFFANQDRVVVSTDHSFASERIAWINQQLEERPDDESLKQRKASLGSGIGIVNIGGTLPSEIQYTLDVVDDVQRACFAALKDGFIPGAGVPLAWAAHECAKRFDKTGMPESFIDAYMTTCGCMVSPMIKILENAGRPANVPDSYEIGINVVTGEKCDLIESGIVDPFAAVEKALKAALSVGIAFVTTKYILSNES